MRASEAAELEALLATARYAVAEALPLVGGTSGRVREKGAGDLVTDADLACETRIRDILAERFPDHGVEGEEYGYRGARGSWRWCIDPIDGSVNYAHGLPWYAISVAALWEEDARVGVVSLPRLGCTLSAMRGGGIISEGPVPPRPVGREDADNLGLVALEFDVCRPWRGQFELMAALAQRSVTCRVMGSGTSMLAAVAAGWVDAALIGSYQPIDHAAGRVLCEEAGVQLRPLDSSNRPLEAGPFVAARPAIAEVLVELYECPA